MHKATRLLRRLYRRGAASALNLIAGLRQRGLPPDQTLVRTPGGLRIARVRVEASPLQAQRENLDLVCSLLTAAKVPFFCVRPLPGRPPVIAVRTRDRQTALVALATCGEPLFAAARPHRGPACGRPDQMRPLSRTAPALAKASAVRVAGYYTSPSRTLVLGSEFGCEVEFWAEHKGRLTAPRPNGATGSVAANGEVVDGREELFNPLVSPGRRRAISYPTRPEFAVRLIDDIDFPIDAVYTWVDGADPIWRAKRDAALAEADGFRESATSEARFTSRDELRYSLRSLTACTPWIRHLWIVTDGQAPPWLDDTHPDITVVDHKEIFWDPSVLPVFNSHAIETQLHHIDGLSEHFLYLNDDFFIGRPLPPSTFFEGNGLTRFFPSSAQVPFGTPELEESPVHAAGMNNRRLVDELSGRTLTQKMKHVPYALRRSLLTELEDRFPAEFMTTSRHRFRDCTDISVVSSLAHHYAYLSGRAVKGSIGYTYVDLALDRTRKKLRTMLALRQHDAFCLNDTAPTTAAQDAMLATFLQSYFPTPSPFERR